MGTEMKPKCLLLAIIVFVFCLYRTLAFSSGLCKLVNCVRGTCDDTLDLLPRCFCDPGWSQPDVIPPLLRPFLPFVPCVIPNCTLNTSCISGAPSLAPPLPPLPPANATPCGIPVCGWGSCQNTSAYNYVCNCYEGYENLLNMTAAPCVPPCALEGDCSKLAIDLSGGRKSAAAPPPHPSDNNKGSATPPSPTTSGVANVIPSRIVMGIVSICFLNIYREFMFVFSL